MTDENKQTDDRTDDDPAISQTTLARLGLTAVPHLLRDRDGQWVAWKYETKTNSRGEPYETKVPLKPFDSAHPYAKPNDPTTWGDFADAVDFHARPSTDTDGVGFMFDHVIVGVDLDDVRYVDPSDDEHIEPVAQEIIDRLDSYTEYSPSGTGYHILVRATLPDGGNKRGLERTLDILESALDDPDDPNVGPDIELYDNKRFFTVSGDHVPGTPETIEQRNDAVAAIHAEYIAADDGDDANADLSSFSGSSEPNVEVTLDDRALVDLASQSNDNFARLYRGDTSGYPSQSEADEALCFHLAFWTQKDARQMDSIFRDSGLMRSKWDESRGDQTYGERTIAQAVAKVSDVYDPGYSSDYSPDDDRDSDGGTDDDGGTERDSDSESDRDPAAEADAVLDDDGDSGNDGVPDGGDVTTPDDPDDPSGSAGGSGSTTGPWYARYRGYLAHVDHDETNESATPDQKRARLASLLIDDYSFATRRPVKGDIDKVSIWRYDESEGVYLSDGAAFIEEQLTAYAEDLDIGDTDREKVVKHIRRATFVPAYAFDGGGADADLVAVENGVVNVDDQTFERGHDPDYYFRTKLPVEYDPDADCPNIDQFLTDVTGDDDANKQTLYEWVGYCLVNGYPLHRFLLLYGTGQNGKGVFFDILRSLFGENGDLPTKVKNTSAVELAKMTSDDAHDLANLDGSYVNIDGDVPGKSITTEQLGKLKKLTGQDPVQVSHKFQPEFDLYNRAKLTFAANDPPRFYEDGNAISRRLIDIEFPREFTGDDERPKADLEADLMNDRELSGLLNRALDALADVYDRNGFSCEVGSTAAERLDTYMQKADPISAFATDCIVSKPGHIVTKDAVYGAYVAFCHKYDRHPADRTTFLRTLYKKLETAPERNRKMVDGTTYHTLTGMWFTDVGERFLDGHHVGAIVAVMDAHTTIDAAPAHALDARYRDRDRDRDRDDDDDADRGSSAVETETVETDDDGSVPADAEGVAADRQRVYHTLVDLANTTDDPVGPGTLSSAVATRYDIRPDVTMDLLGQLATRGKVYESSAGYRPT